MKQDGGNPPSIIYVDSESAGHHVALYARSTWEEMRRRGWRCIWLTSEHGRRHPAAVEAVEQLEGWLEIETAEFPEFPKAVGKGEWLGYEWKQYFTLKRALGRLAKRGDRGVVYLSWMDHCPRVLGAFGLPCKGFEYAGLLMHPTFHLEKRSSGLFGRLSSFLIKRTLSLNLLRKVGMIDKNALAWAERKRISGWEKISYVPDMGGLRALGNRRESREKIAADKDECVLLVYGAINSKKGVAELIEGLKLLSGKVTLFLAGCIDRGIEELLERNKRVFTGSGLRLVTWNRFLSDEEESAAFAAADIVWMGYRGIEGSSGVLLLAASAELPVVACEEGIIGATTREHGIGPSIDVTKPEIVAKAIQDLLSPKTRAAYSERGKRLAMEHHPSVAGRTICDMIGASFPN